MNAYQLAAVESEYGDLQCVTCGCYYSSLKDELRVGDACPAEHCGDDDSDED